MKKLAALAILAIGLCSCAHTNDGIRYDDSIGTPQGYKDLCKRESTAPECGGEE